MPSLNSAASTTPPSPPIYGEFTGRHRARYVEKGMVQHIICRTLGGQSLLQPDEEGKTKLIIHGVIAKALQNQPEVQLYNYAVLPNHAHFMLSAGNIAQVAEFMRYVQSEISKRICSSLGRAGPIFQN